jgi:hypothetical protein
MNVYYFLAMIASGTAAIVHGVVGHRVMLLPLGVDRLFSTRAFGDEENGRRVFIVSWHIPTAVFAVTACAMGMLTFGLTTSSELPRFISVLYATFLPLGWVVAGRRWQSLVVRPIPVAFFTCVTTVAVTGWLGAG